MTSATNRRNVLLKELFPRGIPGLWCPLLTHFKSARQYDAERIRGHLQFLSPHVKGILIAGSTGEGWQMSDIEIHALLDTLLNSAQDTGMQILIGMLKRNVDDTIAGINAAASFLQHPAVVGFTVCPPTGQDLSQQQIQDDIARVLDLGWPTALYQLPQVTQNEMSAETVTELAFEFSNFIMFKDTSGLDRVAKSGLNLGGVYLVRGSESGGYSQWLKTRGGPYDGFLLSSANALASQLAAMMRLVADDEELAAVELSRRIESIINEAFEIASSYSFGNPFAIANKLLDHVMAYGVEAEKQVPPLLIDGNRLNEQDVARTVSLLRRFESMPTIGYLNE